FAVSATIGALAVVNPAAKANLAVARRTAQSLVMLLLVYTVGSAVRSGASGPAPLAVDFFHTAIGHVAIGAACGALAALLQIVSGALMVPALIFLAALRPAEALVTSLVITLAALLVPALSLTAQGRVDRQAGTAMIVGGILGG